MIFGSVCSGIGAPETAWLRLGWSCEFVSEIDKFPRAVLEHRFGAGSDNGPKLFGDFTEIQETDIDRPIDILVGGTPCQSFSIAGLRGGLGDDRGNLALKFLRLAQRLRPRWLVWENVPGVLSSNGGRDFGSILGGMGEIGYGVAYRILDAQYVRVESHAHAVPQRRRRVFVVGYLGDWRRAAAVLFERESLSGHPAPSRKAGERIADSLTVGANQCSGFVGDFVEDVAAVPGWPAEVSPTLNTKYGDKMGLEDQHALNGAGMFVPDVAGAFNASDNGSGRGTPLVPDTAPTLVSEGDAHTGFRDEHGLGPTAIEPGSIGRNAGPSNVSDVVSTLRSNMGDNQPAVAYSIMPMNSGTDYKARETDVAQPVMAGGPVGGNQGGDFVAEQWAVRRLTPTECARLQGFPDDHARIPWRGKVAELCPDGPQYKAYGNSMAVPVMSWIGQRIEMVDAIPAGASDAE